MSKKAAPKIRALCALASLFVGSALIDFAITKWHSGEINRPAFWHAEAYRNIEHGVWMVGDVGGFILGNSISDTDINCEADELPAGCWISSNSTFDLLFIVKPCEPLRIIFVGKPDVAQLSRMAAQSICEFHFGSLETPVGAGVKTLKKKLNTGGWGLTYVRDSSLNAENDTIFSKLSSGHQFHIIDLQPGPAFREGVAPVDFVRLASGIDSLNSGSSGFASVVQGPEQQARAEDTKNDLNHVEQNNIFSGFRHAPLFAQIGFIVACCFAAWVLVPIGFDWATERRGRFRWAGFGFLAIGCIGYGLLCAVVLSV